MARTKATARRQRQPTFVAAPGQRIGNKNIMNRKNSLFKIKTFLPQTLQVKVKKKTNFKKNERQKKGTLFRWKQKVEILLKTNKFFRFYFKNLSFLQTNFCDSLF